MDSKMGVYLLKKEAEYLEAKTLETDDDIAARIKSRFPKKEDFLPVDKVHKMVRI
jgi:hypothetical protein